MIVFVEKTSTALFSGADMDSEADLTDLLRQLDVSDPDQSDALFRHVYNQLRSMAAARLRDERLGHTLQPTALVNELYLRLAHVKPGYWKNRAHFFGAAARAMRQILVDHARRHLAVRRGGQQQRVSLTPDLVQESQEPTAEIIDLHNALDKLAAQDPVLAQVVELRFFAGMTLDEAADALKVSRRKVAKDWAAVRLWLRRELADEISP